MKNLIVTSDHEFERRYRLVDCKLRQITKRPEIDAQNRRSAPCHQSRSRDHRAVSSERYQQITVVGDFSCGSGKGPRRQFLNAVVDEEVDLVIGCPFRDLRRELARAWFTGLGDYPEACRWFHSQRQKAKGKRQKKESQMEHDLDARRCTSTLAFCLSSFALFIDGYPQQNAVNYLYVVGLNPDFECVVFVGEREIFIIESAKSFAGFLLDALEV